jgi:hypothetical protein
MWPLSFEYVPTAGRITSKENTREARITAYLSNTFPKLVPEVFAYDPEKDRLLTGDSGQHLSTSAKVEVWHWALRHLATFQRQADRGAFQKLGCR